MSTSLPSGDFNPFLFRKISSVAATGFFAIALSYTPQIMERSKLYVENDIQKASLEAGVNIETAKAVTTRKTAEAYRENQTAQVSSLIVQNYVLNKTPPQLDWSRSVDPSKKTRIYDSWRQCVGVAFEGRFYFISQFANICEATEHESTQAQGQARQPQNQAQ